MSVSKTSHHFDVVIIGSGLGGLVSGILLSKADKKVAVLEKNNQFGGNLQTFVREKTIFDTGVHYVGGLAKDQNLYNYFSCLDILDDLEWEQLDENQFDQIYFQETKTYYPQAQGYQNFVTQLAKQFPKNKDEIQLYIETIQEYCKAFPLYGFDFEGSYQAPYLEKSVQEVLNEIFTNKELIAVVLGNNFLYALNYEQTPFYVHALTVNSYIESAWRCVKGGSQLTKALTKQLKKHGGKLFKYQEVTGFLTDEINVLACETVTDVFYASDFVSNINLKTTFGLLPENLQKKPSIKRINTLKVTPSVFSVHLVLKKELIPYFNSNIYHYDELNQVFNYDQTIETDFPKMMVITTNPKDKNQTFTDNISVMTYMDFHHFQKWEHTKNTVKNTQNRGSDYEAFKEELTEKVIDKLQIHFPEIRKAILHVSASTPLTYRDYIGLEKGNLYGFEKVAHQPHITQIMPQTKIPNLWLCGQNVRMHGILGVTISAFHLAKAFLGTHLFNDLIVKK